MTTSFPASDAAGSITLNASCHCRGFSASYTLPTSAFPLRAAICSCDSCRHVTGQLWASFAVMPEGVARPSGRTVKQYAFSRGLTVNFCRVCGATIANFELGEWEFATGILSVSWPGQEGRNERREGKGRGIEGLLDRQCMFVSDTRDGGGVVWFPSVNSAGREMKRHEGRRGTGVVDVEEMRREFDRQALDVKRLGKDDSEERLHAQCHCGGVKFYITRPTPTGEPREDVKKGKWWLADPEDARCQKYVAQLDACDSCRLATGFEVNAWTFVPPCNIFTEDSQGSPARPFEVHDESLNMAHYSSSEGAWRSFCRTCGAPVCFRSEKRDVQILDFGVGLFKGNGARCEEWFEWKGLEYEDDTMDKTFVKEIVARAGKGGH